MAMQWIEESSKIKIKCKTGTLASGNDAIKTNTFSGAKVDADAETIVKFSDAFESVITTPVIEILQEIDYEATDVEEEGGGN